MNRRELLATLGVASGAMAGAGCLEEQSVPCRPQDGDVELDDIGYDDTTKVSFRGAVVGFSDGVLIDDSTGVARVTTSDEQYIETDSLDIGDCLSGRGIPSPYRFWQHRHPVVVVTSLESIGRAKRGISRLPDKPSVTIETEVSQQGEDCDRTVELRHDGGEEILAGNLLVARRSVDGEITAERADWWDDLSDSTDPQDPVKEGDSVTVTQGPDEFGTLAWVDSWSTQLDGWRTDGC